jgi:hypothetical protein
MYVNQESASGLFHLELLALCIRDCAFQGREVHWLQVASRKPILGQWNPATPAPCGGQNAGFDAHERVGILEPIPGAGSDQLLADMIAPTPRPGDLAEMAMDDSGILLVCDSRSDQIYQFDTRKRERIKSWPAKGDGAADMALDQSSHRLFVGSRTPPKMTVYDSMSGKEIQSLPGPETMDGVHYNANLKRVYMTGGRWYGTPDASRGWVYVYEQKDAYHYDVISIIKTRPGSGTSLFVSRFNRLYVASQAIGDQEAAILGFEPVQR